MNLSIYFTPHARQDVLKAYEWYDRKQAGLGQRFKDEMSRVVESIASNPLTHPIYKNEVRCARLKKFSRYGIYYIPYESRVVVYAVQHGSRNITKLTAKLPFDSN
jgi:plasmid stabilization system protein ParE